MMSSNKRFQSPIIKLRKSMVVNKTKRIQFILFQCATTMFLFLMFLFPVSTLSGAESGLLLWFNTILPTLLPCIIISNLVVLLDITTYISFLFSPILSKIFHLSKEGSYPIIISFLSGIPIGAKTCGDMVSSNKISLPEGQFLMSFCSNPSYIFITSYIAMTKLGLNNYKFHLLGIIYLSSILSACIYRYFTTMNCNQLETHLDHTDTITKKYNNKLTFELVDSAIINGFEVITKIGGYIILFSILSKIILDIGSKQNVIKLIIVGLLEITTGIDYISNSSLELSKKIVLVLTITAFGGLSSIAQTKSVIANSRLSITTYIKVKLINAIITFIVSTCFVILYF